MRSFIMLLVCSASLFAQYPASATGFQWTGTTSVAGPFCWGFNCVPEQATVSAGESGTLMIRGEANQSYAIAISAGASNCLSLSGIMNQLVLDLPLLVTHTGVLNQLSPILACPSGQAFIPITIPSAIPSGFSFSIQGICSLPGSPAGASHSFTQALSFTVL